MNLPSPVPCLDFPLAMPHTHSQRQPSERRGWSLIDWKHVLAYITRSVNQELLLRNADLVMENPLLRRQIQGRIRLSDGERKTLARIGRQLGKQTLEEIATIVKPDKILARNLCHDPTRSIPIGTFGAIA